MNWSQKMSILVILLVFISITHTNSAISEEQGVITTRPKRASDILENDLKPVPEPSIVGTVPTLPYACPILGDCALPGDEERAKHSKNQEELKSQTPVP